MAKQNDRPIPICGFMVQPGQDARWRGVTDADMRQDNIVVEDEGIRIGVKRRSINRLDVLDIQRETRAS